MKQLYVYETVMGQSECMSKAAATSSYYLQYFDICLLSARPDGAARAISQLILPLGYMYKDITFHPSFPILNSTSKPVI